MFLVNGRKGRARVAKGCDGLSSLACVDGENGNEEESVRFFFSIDVIGERVML